MNVDHRGSATAEGLTRWRRRQLVHAGFSPPLAARVGADSAYDLHALIELVERGCAPELAVRILAPLEGRPR
jgi:hypothetical protein